MDKTTKDLEHRVEDYSRFLVTLLILGTFFYFGMVISYFLEPNGKGSIMAWLTLSTLTCAGIIAGLLRKWQIQRNQSIDE
ncbi:YrhC family protein [Sediminibacillus massiliensis]|uniref:YrhC family protein n=1 Tax=Sediminibacillus massiliensis TaxID=1926277 RepID=UPI0009885B9B|nr:YrhC family protein [Sediminibacillus massiliensis]